MKGCLIFFLVFGGCARPFATPTNSLVAARPYRVVLPDALAQGARAPVLIVLHGLGHDGAGIERYYGLDNAAALRGVIVAYPDGTKPGDRGGRSRDQRFWNATDLCCDFFGSGVDDVAYLDAIFDDLSAKYPVDPKRLYVMGLSNGGYMAYRYACDRASRVAAIVDHAGAMWADRSRCKPTEPVAVLHVHGTADDVVPYEGGRSARGQGPKVPSSRDAVDAWVAFDACEATPQPAAPMDLVVDETPSGPAETTVERWGGCRGVERWTLHGAVHSPRLRHPAWENATLDWLLAHPKP